MSNSRIKNGAYVIERPDEYFDDYALATFLLVENRDEFERAIRFQPQLQRAIKGNDFSFFANTYVGIPDEELKQSGKEKESRELFKLLRDRWEPHKDDGVNSVELPSHDQLMDLLKSYTLQERKQLWDLMSDEVRKRVGFDLSGDENEYDSASESEENLQFRLK